MTELATSLDVVGLHSQHQNGVSIRELARRSGVSDASLRKRFRAAGLPSRDRGEATALANKARKGEKRSDKTAYEYIQALRERKAAIIVKWKSDRGCKRCDESHLATLDLHHRDPATKHPRLKRKNASTSRRTGGYFWRDLSYKDLAEELAKCDVLCSNCHRKVTWEARQA